MGLEILHANSNILMQNGLKAVLQGGGIDQIDAVGSERELMDLPDLSIYDLLIIDPLQNEQFNVSSTARIKAKYPNLKVLVISEVNQTNLVMNILEKGVHGYLTRQCDADEIKHAVFAISKGEQFYCNKVLDLILNKTEEDSGTNCLPTALSERENEIAAKVAGGNTNKQIADELCISPHTVHTHRKNIMKKLGISSASELTVYAINVGLI